MSTREPSEAELLEALKRIKVEDVLLQTVASLVNLAGQKLAVPEARDPVEAKKAIDAVRAMLPLCPQEEIGPVKDALSQVQMMYVREQGEGGEAPPPAEERAGEAERREAEERAKARSKIWTPGS
ncbi:MAG TPA: hypothetical protein VFB44_03905 [Thermoleophilaceae bacterium]|nr:hypothetical protein [Thermoleophilaceae bacterium]